MDIVNVAKNSKYIGYECVVCKKKMDENERQKTISLGCFQTWCMLCIAKKYPDDKHFWAYIKSNGNEDNIIIRNKLLNDE